MPAKPKTKKTPKNIKAKTAPKKAVSKPAAAGSGRHVYLLIIMILITAIFIIINSRNDNLFKFINFSEKKSDEKKIKNLPDKKKESGLTDKKETKDEEKPDAEKPLTEVKIFFIRINESTEKIVLTPVERKVKKVSLLENTINELIKGPTQKEKKTGLISAFPENVKLRKASVKNGIAELDFSSAIESGSGSDILMSRIDQIIWTATQLDGINGVQIKINGKAKSTLGNEGISISGILTRKK